MSDASGAPAKDSSKLLQMAFIGINMIFMLGGAFFVYTQTLGHHEPVTFNEDAERQLASFEETLRKEPVFYTMDTFNTNLDGVPRRLVRMEITLEMLDAEGFEEVIGMGAVGRDAIVRILNSKGYDQLESVQGKLHLKNQIIAQLNSFMKEGVVRNIYFNDFVVQ